MSLYLAFSCVTSSIVLLAWEVVEVFRTANEKDFFAGTRGCSGLVVALAVGLRHAYPLEAGIEFQKNDEDFYVNGLSNLGVAQYQFVLGFHSAMVAGCGGETSSIAEFGDSSAWKDHGWSDWSHDRWDEWSRWEGWNEWQNWEGRSWKDTDRRWQSQPEEWAEDTPPQPKSSIRNRWGREASSSSNQVVSNVRDEDQQSAAAWLNPANSPSLRPTTVVVLGMPKCGTTSLHESFLKAGFRSVHWAMDAGKSSKEDTRLRLYGEGADERLIGQMIAKAVRQGLPPFAFLPSEVNAFAEMNGCYWTSKRKDAVQAYFPQMQHLRELRDAYPDAYFILNTRKPEDWVKSVDKHNDMRLRFIQADLPGLPKGCGERDEDLLEWVTQHHKRVMDELRQHNLLCFNIDLHGAEELSTFLGRRMEWPHCTSLYTEAMGDTMSTPSLLHCYSLHSPRPCWATAVSRVALCTCGLFCRMVLSPIFDVAVALEKMGGMRLLASPDTEVFSCQSPW
eukprot:symbB.v1.2.040855.t1/scaffold7597.1/size11358/2